MTTPTTVNVRLQLRADTAANWTAANPTLLANEVGLETDTKKLKVGNGSTAWNSLAYFPSIVSGGTVLGNLEIGSTGTLTFEGSTADGFETTLAVTNPTADRTITLPNQSGTVVVSGNASIVDADIAANAEIAVSKLADGAARQLLQTDAAGTGVEWTSNVDIPGTLDVTSTATFDGDVTVAGNLTVNGTTTNINTQNLVVEDKNIILGDVATPTDVTADGGGITLKGATDKTINWVDATDAWTSSERFSVPLGSAASPSLTFTGDENSGVYSPGSDQVAIATGGTGRLFVDASGNVAVSSGGVSPSKFHVEDGSLSIQRYLPSTSALILRTSSGNTAAPTAISSSSNTGIVLARGYDGSAFRETGRIEWWSDGAISSTSSPGYLSLSTTPSGSTSVQERLRITSAGLVGVGTSSPINSVDVNGGVGIHYTYGIRAYRDQETVNNLILGHTYTNSNDQLNLAPIGQSPTSAIAFKTATGSTLGTRMFIGPTGNVGIGTTSPAGLLHCNLGTSFAPGANWDANTAVFGGSGNAGSAFAIAHDTTNGTRLMSIEPGVAWRALQLISSSVIFKPDGANEKARFDTSGRLLVGTSSARDVAGNFGGTTNQILFETVDVASFSAVGNKNDSSGPIIALGKSRSGSVGGVTAVQAEDILGAIKFAGANGTDLSNIGAEISAVVDGTPFSSGDTTDLPGRLVFSTTKDGQASPTEACRIDSNQRLGVGTVTPERRLDVQTNQASTYTARVWNLATDGHCIDLAAASSNTTGIFLSGYSTSAGAFRFYVYSNGNIQNTNNSYGAISDIKLKENIVDAASQWDDIKAVQVRNYNLKSEPDHRQIGVVAQEIEQISPGLVSESPDRDAEGNDLGTVTKSVNYSVLYMKAVKALQEAMERIELLEVRLDAANL